MNTPHLNQLTANIAQLTLPEQVWLMEHLAHQIYLKTVPPAWENDLLAMANDPQIQAEIRAIRDIL